MFTELLVLLTAIWTLGRIFRFFHLPGLFAELLAGILVGPLILNVVHDTEVMKILAEFGIFFLMLHSGLETDPKEFFGVSKKSFPIAIGGMTLPFLLGYLIAIWFGYSFEEGLYVGMGLAITSIAISARLFKETQVQKSIVAHATMGAALTDDILALILFSVVLNIVEAGSVDVSSLIMLTLKIVVFFGVVLFIGHKFFRYLHKVIYPGNKGFTFTLIIALAFGLFAELIGLHIIIGAFLAGLFIREEVIDEKVFAKIEDRVFGLSYSFFGPIFIASLAFHLDFSIFRSAPIFLGVLFCGAILGKVLGAGLPAYFSKMKPAEALGVGIAMNNRGEVTLIIATIGLKLEIISQELFSALVIMAFATTLFSVLTFKPVSKKFHTLKDAVVEKITGQRSI